MKIDKDEDILFRKTAESYPDFCGADAELFEEFAEHMGIPEECRVHFLRVMFSLIGGPDELIEHFRELYGWQYMSSASKRWKRGKDERDTERTMRKARYSPGVTKVKLPVQPECVDHDEDYTERGFETVYDESWEEQEQ